MAWSDAARAAALEARRRHGRSKATPATARAAFDKYNAAVQAQQKPSDWNAKHYPNVVKVKAKAQARFTFHVPTKAYSAGGSGMVRVGSGHTLRGKNSQEARGRLYRMLDLKAGRR